MGCRAVTLLTLLGMLLAVAACGEKAAPPATPTQPPPTPTSLPPTSSFDLGKLLIDVFDPQPGEKVLVMVDLPHGRLTDYQAWAERRESSQAQNVFWPHTVGFALGARRCSTLLARDP